MLYYIYVTIKSVCKKFAINYYLFVGANMSSLLRQTHRFVYVGSVRT